MVELNTPLIFLQTGLRRMESGDLEGARDALLQAANSGDPDVAPQAANALALVVAESDPAMAEAALKLSIQSGHQLFAYGAAWGLGVLYQDHGNLPAALQSFELAAQAPDEETAALAREAVLSLSDTHAEVIAGMDPPEAAFTHGIHLRALGDLAGAVAALERCIATRDAEFAPYAACQLGTLMAAEGNPEAAKRPLALAVQSMHDVYTPLSANLLAELLMDDGAPADARELLVLAARHRNPDPDNARRVTEILAGLLAEGSQVPN
jgi:tetratricopeptide (TPR) repeat protein